MVDSIERYDADDDAIAEAWVRRCDDLDVRGVEASRLAGSADWPWQVVIYAAEIVRGEPFESHFRSQIEAALGGVAGVSAVAEEDREVWLVAGTPDGRELVQVVADALDSMASRIEAATEG